MLKIKKSTLLILNLIMLTLISCSVNEQCGVVTKTQLSVNPSCIFVTVRFDDGRVETLLTRDLSTHVGDYKCY